MSSNIYISRIDTTFPRAGQNNDSQGFRDNFGNIVAALEYTSNNIEDLQSKALLKGPLVGSSGVDNDMNWTEILRPQLKTFSESYFDVGTVGSYYEVDYYRGNLQRIELTQTLSIQFVNFPPAGHFGRLKIWFRVPDLNFRVILPDSVSYGINSSQIINQKINFTDPGDYLLEIASVDNGMTFWFIDFANLGGSGSGGRGATGATGIGATGATGPQGPIGQFGGVTLNYRFRNITSNESPGDGFLSFNEEDITTATELYISDKDINADLVEGYLRTVDDSTSPIKGHFKVTRKNFADAYAIFSINSLTENDDYFVVSCNYLNGDSSFINTDELFITFVRTGDVGPAGPMGATGPQGIPGTAVYRGATGATGPIGPKGDFGPLGSTGATGVQGIQGPIGFQGSRGDQGYTGSQGETGYVGSQGIPGAATAIGYTGSYGDTGATGATGPQGIPGIAAYRGATGATGPRGATGPIGATGMSGDPGATGQLGYTGSQGDAGPPGEVGATGPRGEPGNFNLVPVGTTADRPEFPTAGMIRLNSDTLKFEGYNGVKWIDLSNNI